MTVALSITACQVAAAGVRCRASLQLFAFAQDFRELCAVSDSGRGKDDSKEPDAAPWIALWDAVRTCRDRDEHEHADNVSGDALCQLTSRRSTRAASHCSDGVLAPSVLRVCLCCVYVCSCLCARVRACVQRELWLVALRYLDRVLPAGVERPSQQCLAVPPPASTVDVDPAAVAAPEREGATVAVGGPATVFVGYTGDADSSDDDAGGMDVRARYGGGTGMDLGVGLFSLGGGGGDVLAELHKRLASRQLRRGGDGDGDGDEVEVEVPHADYETDVPASDRAHAAASEDVLSELHVVLRQRVHV